MSNADLILKLVEMLVESEKNQVQLIANSQNAQSED